MDYSAVIAGKRTRFADLEDIIGRPNFYDDAKKAGDMLREHRSLQKLLTDWAAYEKAQVELAENRVMAKSQEDKEFAEMAAAGCGITRAPCFILGPLIKDGRLQRVLPDLPPQVLPIHAVYPTRRHLSAKVRALTDFLIARSAGRGLHRK